MTRPRTGQRKPGVPLPASAVFVEFSTAEAGAVAVGAATRALSGDSWLARLGPADCVITGCVRGGADIVMDSDMGAADATGIPRAGSRISGMMMRSPIRTMVVGGMLLTLASTITGLL